MSVGRRPFFRASSSFCLVNLLQRKAQIISQLEEGAGERVTSTNKDIVIAGTRLHGKDFSCDFTQSSFRTVAVVGFANFFGDGKTDARVDFGYFIRFPTACLQDKTRLSPFTSTRCCEKITAFGQNMHGSCPEGPSSTQI